MKRYTNRATPKEPVMQQSCSSSESTAQEQQTHHRNSQKLSEAKECGVGQHKASVVALEDLVPCCGRVSDNLANDCAEAADTYN